MKEIFLNIFDKLMKFYQLPIYFFSKKYRNLALRGVISTLSTSEDIIYYSRIVKYDTIRKISPSKLDNVGIVLQGPINKNCNFILETLEYYRSIYPNIVLVISTWKNKNLGYFKERCKQLNVIFIENNIPTESGSLNVNYQLISTNKGIEYLRDKKNVKYILKIRSDQRIYKPRFLEYFINMLNIYISEDVKLNKRIIFLGCENTCKYIPFRISDWMSFGTKEDIERLYSIPLEKGEGKYLCKHFKVWQSLLRIIGKFELKSSDFFYDKMKTRMSNILYKFVDPEIYIISSFYKKYIGNIYYNNKIWDQYWLFLKKYVIIIDDTDIMLYWPKYYRWKFELKNCFSKQCCLGYSEWLDIYLNYNEKGKKYEEESL